MQNFLQKRGKIIFIMFIATLVVCFAFGLFFMTNYKFIYVCYSFNSKTGALEIISATQLRSAQLQNTQLYTYFANMTKPKADGPYSIAVRGADNLIKVTNTGSNYPSAPIKTVYDFQQDMSAFNNLIIIGTLISFVAVALMYLFGNNNRKVYYISNVVSGILLPIVPLTFSIIFIIKTIGLMGTFNENEQFFKVVSAMMNPVDFDRRNYYMDYAKLQEVTENVNSTTFLVGIIIFAIVAIASVLMMVYAVYRYKSSAKRRAEIIERANNKAVTA